MLVKSLIKKSCHALLVLAAVCQVPAQAHEFWIAPVTTPLSASSSVRLSLWVGEQFTGELVGWSKAQQRDCGLCPKRV
jgi:uncharacterized GH25 family protein